MAMKFRVEWAVNLARYFFHCSSFLSESCAVYKNRSHQQIALSRWRPQHRLHQSSASKSAGRRLAGLRSEPFIPKQASATCRGKSSGICNCRLVRGRRVVVVGQFTERCRVVQRTAFRPEPNRRAHTCTILSTAANQPASRQSNGMMPPCFTCQSRPASALEDVLHRHCLLFVACFP